MFLTTVTGGQLINQSGGYIYTPPQYIGADFDEDGIPDLVELYGLLPNGQPLGTNPEKKDSDGDEIDDNVEFNYVHSFLTPDVTLSEYINAIKANSFPGKSDSDGDDLLDSIDKYTMWTDPDPLSASNIQSVQFINVPSADPVQPDFILSIVKSKKIPDDIFFAYADNVTNIGGFAVTSELKSQLLDLEECYNKNGKWSSTNNEAAAHAAKLETDQLVPEYFEYGSNAYYGCWAYNYQAELNAFDYWSNIIDTATQAYTVYITIAGLYQAKLASIEQRTITLSNTEYASTANNVSISGSAAIPDLSNKAVKHPMNDHMPARYAKQLSYIDRASAEKYLDYKSFFNKNWTDEQVRSALNYGYKDALSKGFTSGKYTFTYLGDEVTIYMENGIFKTGYGNYKFTYEELLELLS